MPTRNVNLTDCLDRFIETGVTSGRFSNASEVVREGLRLLEQREQEDKARLKWLRAAAKEGFDQLGRGEGIDFESMEAFDAYSRSHRQGTSRGETRQPQACLRTTFPRSSALPLLPAKISAKP